MLADATRFAMGTVGRAARFAENISSAIGNLAGIVASPERHTVTWPFVAPRTPFNSQLTGRRSVSFASVSFVDVRTVKNAFGVTVNDVALAYAPAHCVATSKTAGRARPFPRRTDTRRRPPSGPSGGRQLRLTDRREAPHRDRRSRRTAARDRASTRSAKEVQAALGDDFLIRALELVPPPLLTAGVRMYQSLGLAELTRRSST